MLVIEIKDSEKLRRDVPSQKKPGEMLTFYFQWAYGHKLGGSAYPVRFQIPLEKNELVHAPGFYSLDNNSFEVDKYGNLRIGRQVFLSPIKQEDVRKVVNS